MKCAKCGSQLPDEAVVCHACGHLLPRADELELAPAAERPRSPLLSEFEEAAKDADKNEPQVPRDREVANITFERERRFNDYWLPITILLVSLVLYIGFSLRHFGLDHPAAFGQDLAVMLLLELPLAVLGMQLLVLMIGLDIGPLVPSSLKLLAFAAAGWVVIAAAAVVADETYTPSDNTEVIEKNWMDGSPQVRQKNDFLNLPYWSILVIAVGVAFQIALLKVMLGSGVLELLPVAGLNWLIAMGLYFGLRFLFNLPGMFEKISPLQP